MNRREYNAGLLAKVDVTLWSNGLMVAKALKAPLRPNATDHGSMLV